MSVRRMMRYRVTIERRDEGTDAYGQPNGTWTALEAIPCYAYTDTTSRRATVDDALTSQLSLRLWVPSGSDIEPTDRVVSVVDRLGATLYGRHDIDGVNPRTGYVEVVCRRPG